MFGFLFLVQQILDVEIRNEERIAEGVLPQVTCASSSIKEINAIEVKYEDKKI